MKVRITKLDQDARRGGALVFTVVTLVSVSGLAGALLLLTRSHERENANAIETSRARYLAEAGAAQSVAAISANQAANFGSAGAPIPFGGGSYWSNATKNADGSMTVQAYGFENAQSAGIEAVMVKDDDVVFHSAVFAGNSSGDPLYDMKFGGTGSSGDAITGNIYSGGNVVVNGSASVNGKIEVSGTITGATGTEGKSLPIPDIAGMNYSKNNDVDVAAHFSSATYSSSGSMGGTAWQLPQSDPAHIFRKNPSDRASNTSKTSKDDYFLEDPYGKMSSSNVTDAAHAATIHLSGVDGAPGSNGDDLVYYIDGNLWVHNLSAYSFSFVNAQGTPTHVTFVVNGNIYISDNILYADKAHDGVALIAIKDANVSDSGNIYFGDPTFGTLEEMDAFMYAENDFLDTNLSASGSARVTVNGNMTAGNQVQINRDFGTVHSKLTVNFDDRLVTSALSLPGLPKTKANAGSNWHVASWRAISAN